MVEIGQMNQSNPIPTYDQTLAALRNHDGTIMEKAIFPFEIDDGNYVGQVTKAIRSLLDRPDLIPSQIVAIKRTLFGLGRLPLRTPGLDVHLSLVDSINNNSTSYDLYLSSDHFAVTSGGFMDYGFGTDSFSGPTFEVDSVSRVYTCEMSGVEEWTQIFCEMKFAELRVEDLSDDNLLDWEHPDGSQFWEWIADHD